MPYQVDQTCYATVKAAAETAATKSQGTIVQVGTNPYVSNVTSVTENSNGTANVTWTLNQVNGTGVITKAIVYTPEPCNLMTASDALAMSWLVVAAWAAVYGVMFLTRALKGETGGDYGNA